jgi:hypothetical protein
MDKDARTTGAIKGKCRYGGRRGYAGPGRSPDRADAMVWALTELLLAGSGWNRRCGGLDVRRPNPGHSLASRPPTC